MHELSLCGSVPAERHARVVKQLAGYTCMQPQHVGEIHLVFKARAPPGAARVQGTSAAQGNSQQQQDFQRLKTMLQSGIYFVQVIGSVPKTLDADTTRNGINEAEVLNNGRITWTFEFKDTPEAGQQRTNTRLISRTLFGHGDLQAFLNLFGYDFTHRYYLEGERFYSRDTTLFLQRVRKLPSLAQGQSPFDVSDMPPASEMDLLDATGSYVLDASIDITDGRNQELRDRAEKELLSLQSDLNAAVKLEKPDRLALDTRVPVSR